MLYPAETILGWRVIRRVSGAQGEEMVLQGKWREVCDEFGNHVGYQIIANYKSDLDILSGTTSTAISSRESRLNAGVLGKSRTAHLPANDERRETRRNQRGSALPPEDAVERAQAKVREWPLKHGDKAIRVYPPQA